MKKCLIALTAMLGVSVSSSALQVTYSSPESTIIIGNGDFEDIPLAVDDQIQSITDVNVHIRILGGYHPDLYSLVFYSDLLDPVGLLFDTGELPDNGEDFQLDFWLDNEAAFGLADFDPGAPAGARYKPLDPLSLSVFNSLPGNANWYLSLGDDGDPSGPDQEAVFIQWELELTGDTAATVPDSLPGVIPALSLLSLIAVDSLRRRKR